MTQQDITRIVRESIEAFNSGDWQRMRDMMADDYMEYEYPTRRKLQGRDEAISSAQGWKQAFPDARGTIANVFGSGNMATVQVTWEGTHQGELMGPQGTIPATGKRAQVKAAQVVRVEGGKIIEMHHYFDLMTLLQQIGGCVLAGNVARKPL